MKLFDFVKIQFSLKDPLTSQINLERVTLLPLNYTRYNKYKFIIQAICTLARYSKHFYIWL